MMLILMITCNGVFNFQIDLQLLRNVIISAHSRYRCNKLKSGMTRYRPISIDTKPHLSHNDAPLHLILILPVQSEFAIIGYKRKRHKGSR